MKGRYYFHFVYGCVDPETQGPFNTYEEMEKVAREKYAEECGDTHAYFWTNLDDNDFTLNSFSGESLEGEEEEEK